MQSDLRVFTQVSSAGVPKAAASIARERAPSLPLEESFREEPRDIAYSPVGSKWTADHHSWIRIVGRRRRRLGVRVGAAGRCGIARDAAARAGTRSELD